MHDTAFRHGRLFFEQYWQSDFALVAELGSANLNGSLRDVVPPGARYVGLDLEPGPGVDVVVAPGQPLPLRDGAVDVVVSSSVFEHDICFWETFLEQARIVRPGGLIYVNAPSNGSFHRHPVDCWRFYPDAGLALAAWAARRGIHLDLLESFVADPEQDRWADFVAVFRRASPRPFLRRGRIADGTRARNIHGEQRHDQLRDVAGVVNRLECTETATFEMRQAAAAAIRIATLEAAMKAANDDRERHLRTEHERDALRAEVDRLATELRMVRRSSSWRLTAPLRWLRRVAR